MFNLHLIWAESTPDDRDDSELYAIQVPVILPEGSLITLKKTRDFGIFGESISFIDVEVTGEPIVDATDLTEPAVITVEVVPVD